MVAGKNLNRVDDSEEIARLLLYPQMFKEGKPAPSVFPVDELLAARGKNGASVDRCRFLSDKDGQLRAKAEEIANPNAGRNPYGYFFTKAGKVRSIKLDKVSGQAFEILPDEIVRDNGLPKSWDAAHALVRRFDSNCSRGQIRGVRDKLIGLFEKHIVRF